MSTGLNVPADRLANGLGDKPFAVTHDLVDHPLLTLEAIAELADYLPADTNVEHNLGDVPEVLPDGEAPRLDLSPGEIVRTIDTNRSWMVLKRIEDHPAYRDLLEHTLSEVTAAVAKHEGPIRKREGFIFISAPSSVTPTHIDPEYNFLLQIRGSKEMVVGEYADPSTENHEVERYYGGGHRNLKVLPDNSQTFAMQPGDGVFVPLHAPHVVRNGPDPSISLSVTWNTEASEQAALVHAFNARLRALRLSPSPPGRRPGVDRAKAGSWMAARSAMRQVKRLRQGETA
jgi:Cupin superfamily protein